MLEQFANIAEIIGVLLVIVTLVFLTLQIRQNTKALRSTTIQAVLNSEMEFGKILIEHAATWDKILEAEPLTEGEEHRRAIMLFNVFMIDSESRYKQYETGFLDPQAWEARLRTLPKVVALPIYGEWRASIGGLSHSRDFLEMLDELAQSESGA